MSEATLGPTAGRVHAGEAFPWIRLSLLAALAGLLATLAVRTVPGRLAPPKTDVRQPLLGIDPMQASEIGIGGREGPERFRLRRGPAGSWLVSDGRGKETPSPAEPVETFLSFLRGSQRLTQFVEGDLAAFGLERPRGEVVLRFEGGDQTVIRIGDRNPPLTALYVQVLPEKDVILVGSVMLWEFDKLLGWARRQAEQDEDLPDASVGR